MGGFHRPHRRLFSCTHTPIVSKVPTLSCTGSGLSVQIPTLRDCDCSIGVHARGERGQVHNTFTRGSNPLVFGQLVGEGQRSGFLCSRCSKIDHSGRKIGVDCQFEKIRTQTNSESRVSGLSFQPSRGFGLSKSKENGKTQNFGSFHFARSHYYSKEVHVTNWGHGLHGEDSSFGSNPYETVSVVSEDQLAVSPIFGQGCRNFSADKGPSGLVDGSSELTQGFESASERTQYADVHRCIREGLGAHLSNCTISGVWQQSERNLPINILELKAVFLGLKHFQGQLRQKIVLVSSDNSTVVFYINKQGGTHSFEMCALMWRILAWSNAREIHIRARHIPGNLNVIADSLSRRDKAIQTEWYLHPQVFQGICQVWHKPMVDLFATSLNAKLPTYVSPVPDDEAWQIDALNISWEALDAYAFCPVAILPQLVQKVIAYRCRVIVIVPGWPGMSWFWGLVEWSAKIPLRLPQVYNLLKQPFSLRFHKNLEYLNLHAWYLDS